MTDYSKYRDSEEFNDCTDDYCDLNPEKICDNCGKCIEEVQSFKIIKITKIIED